MLSRPSTWCLMSRYYHSRCQVLLLVAIQVTRLLPLPDRPFLNFRASASGDHRFLCSARTSIDGFWISHSYERVGRVRCWCYHWRFSVREGSRQVGKEDELRSRQELRKRKRTRAMRTQLASSSSNNVHWMSGEGESEREIRIVKLHEVGMAD